MAHGSMNENLLGGFEVPDQLSSWRFILLVPGKKVPTAEMRGWAGKRETKTFIATDPVLHRHMRNHGNFGVVTGEDRFIVATDTKEIEQVVEDRLPRTFTVRSPRHRTKHFYFYGSISKYIRCKPTAEGDPCADIRFGNSYVLGPGSVFENYGTYQVVDNVPIASITEEQLVAAISDFIVSAKDNLQIETSKAELKNQMLNFPVTEMLSDIEGFAHNGAELVGPHPLHGSTTGSNFKINTAKNVWHCFRNGHDSGGGPLELLAVLEGIIKCEEAGKGCLRGEKFIQTLQKAAEKGFIKENPEDFELKQNAGQGAGGSQADRLVALCMEQNIELFHDQDKTPYARITQSGAGHSVPIRSRSFKAWLASLLWRAEGKAPGTETIYSALNVLEAIALFDGKEYALHNRVAPAEDGVWIDMVDDKWRAIKVTAEGWQIVDTPPILFKRYSHQKALTEPEPGGNPKAFLNFVNIKEEDRNTRFLLLCTIISYFIPAIPHVILVLYGIQGSGKSCFFKIIRRLVDPSAVEVLTLPRDERERVQQLDHHWCAFYDNVTSLPTWMSDTLCRAATGGGFTKRELYTDDSDIIYNFKRCVGLNGINIAAQRGDLLDRSLLVGLEDIPKDKRRTEEHLLGELEGCKASILGGFLDTLVKAIRAYPSVKPKELFRMADFTRWGCAIAVALGHTEDDFIDAYKAKVRVQVEEAAHASPLATVLIDFMEGRESWDGTPSQLYRALANHAKDQGISTRQKAWPKAPHTLVRQLNELSPSLKSLGLEVITGVRTGSARRISVNTVTSVTSDAGSSRPDTSDAGDASTPTSLGLVADLKELVRLTADIHANCFMCGTRGRVEWKFTRYDGSGGFLCGNCGFELQKRRGEQL